MRTPWHRLQVLVSEEQYRALAEAAKERRTSLGALVREAVASHIGEQSPEERMAIVRRMAQYRLPVADWPEMEKEIEAARAEDGLLP